MEKGKESFMQLSSADGEMRVDAGLKTEEELLSVAWEANTSGRRIILVNASAKKKDLLERIAVAGNGNLLFDLR